ncbi:PREDICTED: interleukin-9 [Condylura cristata]|uniref:interleukin-9 n=1 Tax=Condylura cristata TaxID=143302 RepID=UPI000334767F|nr:PREDICTED: interleukin-9 [Condylura cristata]
MLLAVVIASALLLCSVTSQKCSTFEDILNIKSLMNEAQDNCTTPCFQEGLSQMINATEKTSSSFLILHKVKRTIMNLKYNKCQFFSCDEPCKQASTGNTLTFLKRLLEVFQKQWVKGKI